MEDIKKKKKKKKEPWFSAIYDANLPLHGILPHGDELCVKYTYMYDPTNTPEVVGQSGWEVQ